MNDGVSVLFLFRIRKLNCFEVALFEFTEQIFNEDSFNTFPYRTRAQLKSTAHALSIFVTVLRIIPIATLMVPVL
jgi:hypothetical protein